MEPDDQSLHHLLDTTQPAGPDELRTIVAKAGRHRVRFAAVMAGAALLVGGAAGGAIGYASSNHSNQAVRTANAPQAGNSATNSAAPGSGASGVANETPGILGSLALTHVFTRTANGVDIRAYEVPSRALPAAAANCSIAFGPRLEAEVSTDKSVGTLSSGFVATNDTGAVKEVSSDVFGLPEGDPVGVVVASTSSSVTTVKVTFAGGATDQMAPTGGWVALAGPLPAGWGQKATWGLTSIGTFTAYDAAGTKVFSQAFSFGASSVGFGTAGPQSGFCSCGGPIVRPGLPLPAPNSRSTAPPITTSAPPTGASAGSATYACPVIQGRAGSWSAKT